MALQFPLSDLDRRLASDDLFGDRIFAVGGRVRDHFTNLFTGTSYRSKDFDYVIVSMDLDEVRQRLEGVARIDEVGRSFATLKVIMDGTQVDVALARRESSTGTGHRDFTVDFGREVTIEEDARRRDFTMNMISASCRTGAVYDPVGGLDDIRNKRVRMFTPQAFLDDPLRMERAVQFASRFGFTIEDQTYAAIQRSAALIGTCSAERHQEELNKLVGKSAQPSVGFNLLLQTGLLGYIIPEMVECVGVEQNIFHDKDVWGHVLAAADAAAANGGDLVDRYAALFHDVGKPRTQALRSDGNGYSFHGHESVGAQMVGEIFGRLRYPDDMARLVSGLTQQHMYACRTSDGRQIGDSGIRRFIANIRAFAPPEPTREELAETVERQFRLRLADRLGGRPSAEALKERAEENAAFEARVRAELARTPALSLTDIEVDGHDVMRELIAHGIKPPTYRGDRTMKVVLYGLLDLVIEDPAKNTRQTLTSLIPAVAITGNLPVFAPGPAEPVIDRSKCRYLGSESAVVLGRTPGFDGVFCRSGGAISLVAATAFRESLAINESFVLTRDGAGRDTARQATCEHALER